jgi:hypothetical protein
MTRARILRNSRSIPEAFAFSNIAAPEASCAAIFLPAPWISIELDTTVREIIVRFPKPFALFLLVVWLPMSGFLAVAGTLMTLWLPTVAGTFPMWKVAAGYLLFPILVIVSIAGVFAFFLYARETLFTTFRVTDDGIGIVNRHYGSLVLAWADVETARYSRSLKLVVLESRTLKAPIAIMNNAHDPSAQFQAAVVQIKKNVGARWVATWLWP